MRMKRNVILLLFLALSLPCAAVSRPWIILFGSRNCTECAELKTYWKRTYSRPDMPVLVFVDIDKTANYRFLNKIEDELETVAPGSTFPVLLMGRQMVCGRDGFNSLEKKLPELMAQLPEGKLFDGIYKAAEEADGAMTSYSYRKEKNGKNQEPTQANKIADTKTADARLELLFFEQPGCKKCSRQNREFQELSKIRKNVSIVSYDVTTLEGQAMLARAAKTFSLNPGDKNLAPMICWEKGYVTGRLATAKELAMLPEVADQAFWTAPLTDRELQGTAENLQDFIRTLTWWSVISGGLLDGINPCAFATSVFLISWLLYQHRRRRQILLVGGCFCIGVFLTYFLYGLALSFVLRQLQEYKWVKMTLYGGFGILGCVLCVLHLKDAFRFRRTGKSSDMDMGLSKATHRGIHSKIRRFTDVHSYWMAPAAMVLGMVVSSMELACTGQVYFTVLTALSARNIDSHFLMALLVYNACFILPLAVITVLASYGVGAKALETWAKRHVFGTKIFMSALFAALGGLMFFLMAV